MSRNKHVEREVFGRCPETCPAVDDAIDNMLSDIGVYIGEANQGDVADVVQIMRLRVKDEGTERLREALRECVGDLMDARSEVDQLTAQVEQLKDRISYMEPA